MSQVRPIEDLFAELVELESVADRDAFLGEVCGDDNQLRRRLEKLLAANAKAGSFLREDHGIDPTVDLDLDSRLVGSTIGPYKLREVIGEGGMGTVYVAEQEKPLRRKVALKVIKAGMDSKAVIARFEAERNALALMNHPHIAKVLDAGTTEQGRPFFAMELVSGIPITEYCDEHKLSIDQRLELFVQVCQAIQHAHQKGIIHRDIKPTNVLVTELDGKAVPKVIDFGVAKALNQSLTDRSIYTSFQSVIGTPLYMSPEQASLSAVDVDTRSDVYSLGVLLYELLTGTTPLEQSKLKEAAQHEVLRIIREEEPPRPSNRISTLGETASRVSQLRQTQPDRLGRLVKGDLDWIVMTALAKERSRRFKTADAFAADISRFLADEPVEARPPSMGYLASKYVSRNKGLVVASTFVIAAVMIGLIVSATAFFKLNSTVSDFHHLIIDRALAQAVAGNVKELDETMELGIRANLPMDWVLALKGFRALQNGDNQEAKSQFKEAIEYDESNISAKALYSWALFQSGDLEGWSHHVQETQTNGASREQWREFDEFFLGFTDFYVDYAAATKRFEAAVAENPTWMFARLMKALAVSHEAWAGDPDPQLAHQAMQEMESVSGFLPETKFVVSMELFIYMSVLYCDPTADSEVIKSKADVLADKLRRFPKYQIGNWCLLKYYELTNDSESQKRVREASYLHNDGFLFLAAFEHLFANGNDNAILEVTDRGDEVLLMQALVRAWNGEKLAAMETADALTRKNTSWVMRQRIIWVYLACEELEKAQAACASWLESQEKGGSIREMNSDRRAIEIVAEWPDSSHIDTESMSSQHRLHAEFVFGLIALAQRDEDSALLHFERAIAAHDDWEVTRYANAIHTRLSKDLARQKRNSTEVGPKGPLSVADDE